MEIRICIAEIMKRIDLYNKSRVMGDYQARFCERLRVKLPLPTRRLGRYGQAKKNKNSLTNGDKDHKEWTLEKLTFTQH